MSQYIEFSTSPNLKAHEFALGNPLHDGHRPKRNKEVIGVRVDGELVTFGDDAIIEALAKTITDHKKMMPRRASLDCVTFVALMNGIPLHDRHHNPLRNGRADVEIDPDDMAIFEPVLLGGKTWREECVSYRHVVTPAHYVDKSNYLHKLGDDGPICMSSLWDAMEMYRARTLHLVRIDEA